MVFSDFPFLDKLGPWWVGTNWAVQTLTLGQVSGGFATCMCCKYYGVWSGELDVGVVYREEQKANLARA